MRFSIISLLLTLGIASASYAMDDEIEKLNTKLASHHISPPSTPTNEKRIPKTPQSDPRPVKHTFDIELRRYVDKTHTGVYFSKAAKLKCSDVVISDQADPNIFGDTSSLKLMDEFLCKQVNVSGTDGWKRNHLAVNLFAVVDDKTEDRKRCIEGSVLAEEVQVGNNIVYDFSVSPGNGSLNGRRMANFVSSDVLAATVSEFITSNGYVPIYQSKLRPLFDNDNHGDRLAVDTASANIDLFFSLIRKSAHREDMPILGIGMRYYSSYDACDSCFEKIYSSRKTLIEKLTRFAKDGGYKLGQDGNIPLYSLFYSTRPYKEGSYSISWTDPRDEKSWRAKVTSSYVFPKGKGIVTCPDYHFDLPNLGHPHTQLFSDRDSKQINLLRTATELDPSKVYSYVYCFEPKGLPICYKDK